MARGAKLHAIGAVNCYYCNRMHPYTYRIRFLFVHPTMDFTPVRDELSKIPGLNSSTVATYGQERYSHTGQKLSGTYRDSRWGFDFETSDEWRKSEGESIPEAISSIVSKLYPYKELLVSLSDDGADLQLIVSWYVDRNVADRLPLEIMRKLIELRLTPWFDLYPPDYSADTVRQDILETCNDDAYGSWELWWGVKPKTKDVPDRAKNTFLDVIENLVKENKLSVLHHRSWDGKENTYERATFDRTRLKYEIEHSRQHAGLDPDTFYWFELTEAGQEARRLLYE
jgi:hypothetical protein